MGGTPPPWDPSSRAQRPSTKLVTVPAQGWTGRGTTSGHRGTRGSAPHRPPMTLSAKGAASCVLSRWYRSLLLYLTAPTVLEPGLYLPDRPTRQHMSWVGVGTMPVPASLGWRCGSAVWPSKCLPPPFPPMSKVLPAHSCLGHQPRSALGSLAPAVAPSLPVQLG